MKNRFLNGWMLFLHGQGRVNPPDPGNTANPPGNPPVQVGSYEYIQPFAFQGAGHAVTDIPYVPPEYQNVGEFAMNVYDPSGLTGGGFSNSPAVQLPTEQALFYDPNSGNYYQIG